MLVFLYSYRVNLLKELTALLFDVDGTLADTEEVHRHAFNTIFSRAGLDWKWSRTLYGNLLGVTGGKERIRHFASRDAMDIEGLGEKLIAQIVDAGLAKNPPSLYRLTVGGLVPLERMAEKSAENIVGSIQKSKKTTLPRLVFALGIRNVGVTVAEILAERYATIEGLCAAQARCAMASWP